MGRKHTLSREISRVLAHSPVERARSIIDSQYTRQIMEQLPSQEAYLIIKDAWGTDSQILLQYVNPETITHFIDLDCWDKGFFSIDSLADWLFELYTSSSEILLKTLEILDLEIIVLFFQSYFEVVHVVPTDERIPDLIDEGFESLDNIYYFRIIKDDEREYFIKDLLSSFFSYDQYTYYQIMEGVINELRSSMEETIFERRSLRLMEQGFPPPEEALGIYQHIKPSDLSRRGILKEKTPYINKDLHQLPVVYLESISQSRGLILKTLEKTSRSTQERFLYEMIYLANKVIMADFRPLNDSTHIKASMDKASCIASLGLEVAMLERGLPADVILDTTNADTLFSLGYNMISEQQRRLRLILDAIEVSMIPESLSAYVEGLLRKRPQYKDREFSSLAELDQVKASIDRMESMIILISNLHWEDEIKNLTGTNVGSGIDLENVLLTSLVVNFSERVLRFRPLSINDLIFFIHNVSIVDARGQRVLRRDFTADLHAFLRALQSGLGEERISDVVGLLVSRFEEELSTIVDIDHLDVRFITCFVVRLTTSTPAGS